MKQKITKQSPSSRRRWPAVLLTLICCLAVLTVALLSPVWFNVWADKLNNRTVHVSSITDESAALSCAQRLDVYQSYRQTSVYNLDTTNVSESEAILEASLKEVEVLHQITGLPCFALAMGRQAGNLCSFPTATILGESTCILTKKADKLWSISTIPRIRIFSWRQTLCEIWPAAWQNIGIWTYWMFRRWKVSPAVLFLPAAFYFKMPKEIRL